MRYLTIEEKMALIIDLCRNHHITSYEIGNNTPLNGAGVHRILSGLTKKPRNKTLNTILDYLEKVIVGSKIPGHPNYFAALERERNYDQNELKTDEPTQNPEDDLRKMLRSIWIKQGKMEQMMRKDHDLLFDAANRNLEYNEDLTEGQNKLLDNQNEFRNSFNDLAARLAKISRSKS